VASVRVLVYVDPSPRGEWALHLATLLPRPEDRVLVLLATAEDATADPELLMRARTRLAPTAAAVETTARPGPAERAVGDEVRSRDYGLVVVPPAGRNAIQRMLRGSRVATIVHSVRAPVLVARRPPPRLERILAAVSGGQATAAVGRAAAEVGDALRAALTFIHVASEVAMPFPPHGGRALEPGSDPAEAARAVLRTLGRREELLVRDGLVVEEVLAEFEHTAHHLLVLGVTGGGPPGWGREDVTERILLRCPGSTLVVPA
jgi:nucleotide-binding universal stress UspA family protein